MDCSGAVKGTGVKKIEKLQDFYSKEKALVTSPFITQQGEVNERLLTRVFSKLSFDASASVILDAGCGSGLLSTHFKNNHLYIGMDIVRHSPHARLMDTHHRFIQCDSQFIPLADHTVDRIVCLDSFEHYPVQQKAAREFHRILKPDGAVFLSIPTYANVAGLVKKIAEGFGTYEKNTWAPFDFWKPEELEHFVTPGLIKRLFREAGFTRFKKIGYANEVAIGLCPWIWHPKMPQRIGNAMHRLLNLFSKPIVTIWPSSSLHTFWKIEY